MMNNVVFPTLATDFTIKKKYRVQAAPEIHTNSGHKSFRKSNLYVNRNSLNLRFVSDIVCILSAIQCTFINTHTHTYKKR